MNDTEEHMTLVREAIEGSPGLVRVEMLRYHKTAGAKYAMIDTHYDRRSTPTPKSASTTYSKIPI